MLTGRDFDDIGKRLYDLEADPPEKGWNKIAADIIPPPPGSSKQHNFASRHWWKGLLVIVPITIYLAWPEVKQDEAAGNLSSIVSEDQISEGMPGMFSRGGSTDVFVSEVDSSNDSIPATPNRRTADTANGSHNIGGMQIGDSNEILDASLPQQSKTKTGSDVSNKSKNNSNTPGKGIADETGKTYSRTQFATDAHSFDNRMTIPATNEEGYERFVATSEKDKRPLQGASVEETENANIVAIPDRTEKPRDQITGDNIATRVDDHHANVPANSFDIKPLHKLSESDSARGEMVVVIRTQQELAHSGESEHDQKDKRPSTWRLTAAIAPQFSYRTVRPVGNDDVLVTNIKTGSGYPERAGFGFAVGAGKEITRNLYLDGQLTYSRTSQTIGFAYASGKIDTLLAIQGQDGNVRVIPVYQVSNREQKSTIGYGGVRMTATHYFWLKGKRRFNISAGAGLNFMASNTFEEKINGTWVSHDNHPLGKINSHLTLGAGYNLAFGNGWEIMLSPMFTRYLKKIETNQQPFQLGHRSYGLNIMLSKLLR